jgi:hypothetical protein
MQGMILNEILRIFHIDLHSTIATYSPVTPLLMYVRQPWPDNKLPQPRSLSQEIDLWPNTRLVK